MLLGAPLTQTSRCYKRWQREHFIIAPIFLLPLNMHTQTYKPTETFPNTNRFLNTYCPVQCPGPGSSQNNSGAAPPAATRWKLPLGPISFSGLCVCACACIGRDGVLVECMCQPVCTCYPTLRPITLHSGSILLHPATNMYVTSPSILSPLCRSGTSAPASASNCLWWLTVTQPPFLLVCLSRYKILMILCDFFCHGMSVCILCVFVYIHTTQDGFHHHHKGQFGLIRWEWKQIMNGKQTFSLHKNVPWYHLGHGKSSTAADVFI